MIDTRYVIEGPQRIETMGSYVRMVEARWPKRYVVELAPIDDQAERNYENNNWGPMEQGPGLKESVFETYEGAAAFIRLLRSFKDYLDHGREVADISVGVCSVELTRCKHTEVIVRVEVSIAPERDDQGFIQPHKNGYTDVIMRREILRKPRGENYYRLYNTYQELVCG